MVYHPYNDALDWLRFLEPLVEEMTPLQLDIYKRVKDKQHGSDFTLFEYSVLCTLYREYRYRPQKSRLEKRSSKP
jgi:hypothetical protein